MFLSIYCIEHPILSTLLFLPSGFIIASVFTTIHIYSDRIIIDKPALPFYKPHVFFIKDMIYAGFVFGFKAAPKFEVKTINKTKSFFQCFEINERDRIVDAIEFIGIKSYRL